MTQLKGSLAPLVPTERGVAAAAPDQPVRATVRVHLVNPESGYESETTGKVTAAEWAAIDAILCGRGAVYTAAPALLEALTEAQARWHHMIGLSSPVEWHRLNEKMTAAIQSATGEG